CPTSTTMCLSTYRSLGGSNLCIFYCLPLGWRSKCGGLAGTCRLRGVQTTAAAADDTCPADAANARTQVARNGSAFGSNRHLKKSARPATAQDSTRDHRIMLPNDR